MPLPPLLRWPALGRRPFGGIAAALWLGSLAVGCARAELAPPPPPALVLPGAPGLPRQSDGRHYPVLPRDPQSLARLLVAVELAVRDAATPETALPALGHQQQVIYRVLAERDGLSRATLSWLPTRWRSVAERAIAALSLIHI